MQYAATGCRITITTITTTTTYIKVETLRIQSLNMFVLASENFEVYRLVSGDDCTVSLQDDWEWLLKAVEGVETSEGAL